MYNFAPYLNVPGVTLLGGTGSLSIPISISEGEIDLASTVLKINNVTFQKGNGKRDVIGFFKKGNNAFMVRTGQLILDGSSNLQIDLDGWLMPMRKKDSFTKDGITLTSPLFKSGEITSVPSEITDRQRLLFQTLSESK